MQSTFLPRLRAALAAALVLGTTYAQGAATFDPSIQPFGDVPPLALTGFNLSTGTQRVFQTFFSNTSFSGDVSAYPVGTDGKTQTTNKIWSATNLFNQQQACAAGSVGVLPGATTDWWDVQRVVVTRNGATGIPFRFANLSATQLGTLDADVSAGGKADLITRYIRGDRSNENFISIQDSTGAEIANCGSGTTNLRGRVSIFGDVIHTRPVYVGPPPADYTFDSYQTFKSANATRPARLYVGANDGMVHAFDADTGDEQWAYVPSMLIPKLKLLTVSPYSHAYFIDGQMTAGDVNFGTTASPDWRTVIVGGLGAGGQGLFALDVTDGTISTEAVAKTKILWEITPSTSGFADLGYTYGNPVIAKMNTGEWAAIFNNGYLNGGSGHSVLYIVNIQTGALIKALDTGAGSVASPSGLSSSIAVDTNFDIKVDRIYAGDIDGNVWKFDVSAASAATWPAPTKVFPTATDTTNGIIPQAIVGGPDVAAHPLSGYLVYFANGRMFTAADATDTTSQNYAYGLWDGAPSGTNTTFLTQSMTEKSYALPSGGSQRVRVSSGLAVNWNNYSDPIGNPARKGWRTALATGERVLGTGFVRDSRYQFTGTNPTVVQTPKPDGENWLIELDYLTGGAQDNPIFDLNSDRVLDDTDRVLNAAGTAPQTGATGIPVAVYMGKGLVSQPLLANVSAQLSTTLFNDNPFTSPAEVPYVAPTPPANADRGVFGGHFDVEIYIPNSAGFICNYNGSQAPATVSITFTDSNSRTAPNLSITLGGVQMIAVQPTTGKTRSQWATWLNTTSNLTGAILANWNVSKSSNTVTFTAKANGTVWNGKTLVVTPGTSATLTSSMYSTTSPSSGGVDFPNPIILTTSSTACYRDRHIHKYDKLFDVTGMNMLNASDANYNLSNVFPNSATPFKILVANQYLNPAVTLSIGNAPYVAARNFTATPTLSVANLPTYTRANIGTFAFNMPTDAFSAKDWWNGPADGPSCNTNTAAHDCRIGLIPTTPNCVYQASRSQGGNRWQPVIPPAFGVEGPMTRNWPAYNTTTGLSGATGVMHGGAFTILLIDPNTPDSAIELNDQPGGRPEFGWRVKEQYYEQYVLGAYTTFNHYIWRDASGNDMTIPPAPTSSGLCAWETGWTKQPIANTSPDSVSTQTPAAGSADPGAGTTFATVVSTSTNTTTSGGTTTTTTTTNFSNGGTLVVTSTTTGGVTTTTSVYTPPPPGSGSGSGSSGSGTAGNAGVGQAVASPNTITGYQQTRNSGKLGRVTWHELFRQ